MMLINEDASSQPLVANATVPGVLNGGADPADESSELGATLNVVNLIAIKDRQLGVSKMGRDL